MHVQPDKRRENVFLRARRVEDNNVSTFFQYTVLFLYCFLQVDHIPHEKAGHDGIKRRIAKGKMERVGRGKIQHAASLSDTHHFEGKIGSNDFGLRELSKGLTRQVAGARTQVKQS